MLGRLSLDRFHAGTHCSGPNDVLAARYRSAATRGLIVFCVAFPLMRAPGVMADQIAGEAHAAFAQHPDQDIGLLLLKVEQQIAAGHTVDPESDNALDTWQAVIWQAVITKAHPASPEVLKALATFAAHMRDRAEAEKAAGRSLASTDFSAFAEAANDLLKHVAPTSSPQGPQANASRSAGTVRASSGSAAATTNSATSGVAPTAGPAAPANSPPADATGTNATRPPTPAAQTALAGAPPQPAGRAAPGNSPPADAIGTNATRPPTPTAQTALAGAPPQPTAGPAAPGNSPPADATGTNATGPPTTTAQTALAGAPPQPTAGPAAPDNSPPADATRPPIPAAQTALAGAPPAAAAVTRAPTTREQSVAALYASRGDQMLAIKDISAARRFYEYAANAGSARAATVLARTFDPSFLSQLGVVGLRPDPAQAAVWYQKAAELGNRDAENRLHSLSTETAK